MGKNNLVALKMNQVMEEEVVKDLEQTQTRRKYWKENFEELSTYFIDIFGGWIKEF